MVRSQGQQHFIDQEDMLEIIYHALAIQKIHGGCEEVPIERFGELEVLGLAGDVGNGDDLLERNDLDNGDDGDEIDVTGEHGNEEARDHNKRPYRPGYKGLFLLLILRDNRSIGFLRSNKKHNDVVSIPYSKTKY